MFDHGVADDQDICCSGGLMLSMFVSRRRLLFHTH